MVGLDTVHPPAVSTSLAFAYRSGDERNRPLFLLSLLVVALLVLLERGTSYLLRRFQGGHREHRAWERAVATVLPRAPAGDAQIA